MISHIIFRIVQRMFVASLCLFCAVGLLCAATSPANASELETTESMGVYKVEEGIVTNFDTVEHLASGEILAADLQVIPTWQNPLYATVHEMQAGGLLSVAKSACTSSNYRVISSSQPGKLGSSYYYTCWAGTGTYSQTSAMGRYGAAGVSMVCPGNTQGSIEHQYLTDTDNYTWSPTRGPHPNNTPSETSGYCYAFTSLRVYRAVKLS